MEVRQATPGPLPPALPLCAALDCLFVHFDHDNSYVVSVKRVGHFNECGSSALFVSGTLSNCPLNQENLNIQYLTSGRRFKTQFTEEGILFTALLFHICSGLPQFSVQTDLVCHNNTNRMAFVGKIVYFGSLDIVSFTTTRGTSCTRANITFAPFKSRVRYLDLSFILK